MTKNSKKTEEARIELQNERLRTKTNGVKDALKGLISLDVEEKLTPEEMLAIRAGALAAFGYVDALLGGLGKETQRGAETISDIDLATSTMEIGRNVHLESLERLGL